MLSQLLLCTVLLALGSANLNVLLTYALGSEAEYFHFEKFTPSPLFVHDVTETDMIACRFTYVLRTHHEIHDVELKLSLPQLFPRHPLYMRST